MKQVQYAGAPRLRLVVAIGFGATSVALSVLLIVADGIDAGVRWTHHAGLSAAPLFLVAGAIAGLTLARPPKERLGRAPLIAVAAFAAWGLAQLFPSSAAAGSLNDLAILLFVVDAGCVVIADSRTRLRIGGRTPHASRLGEQDSRKPPTTPQLSHACAPPSPVVTQPCCVQSRDLCTCTDNRAS